MNTFDFHPVWQYNIGYNFLQETSVCSMCFAGKSCVYTSYSKW